MQAEANRDMGSGQQSSPKSQDNQRPVSERTEPLLRGQSLEGKGKLAGMPFSP